MSGAMKPAGFSHVLGSQCLDSIGSIAILEAEREIQALLSVSFPASEFMERVNFLGCLGGGPSSLARVLQLKPELKVATLCLNTGTWLFRMECCNRVRQMLSNISGLPDVRDRLEDELKWKPKCWSFHFRGEEKQAEYLKLGLH